MRYNVLGLDRVLLQVSSHFWNGDCNQLFALAMTVSAYAVHPIPSVPSDHHITRYKELRLQALQTNPECFSSTYDRELSMGHDEWKARLHSRDKVTFVAVRTSIQESESELLSSPDEWVGTVTVIGPDLLRQHAFNLPENIRSVEGNVSYYIFTAVRVHPNEGYREKISQRGNGLGQGLS